MGETTSIDYVGPFQKQMFLIVVVSHSKWLEVVQMNSTTASSTVNALRDSFARLGLPEQIFNGPQFITIKKIARLRGIKHIISSPYHPRTNGLAERFVQRFKQAMKKDSKTVPMNIHLNRFLCTYLSTPHPLRPNYSLEEI